MKKRLFFLPMVAIMMAACSSNETIEVNENKGDLISFRPIVKGVTRAADADLSSDGTSFNVEAFNTGTTTSPYFSNVTFTNSGGTFTSATKYYWPTNNLDFYAYSPISSSQFTKTDFKTFIITPSTTVSDQVDFIYANTKNKGKGSTGEVTTLNFRHAGAKIVVKVKNSAPNLKFEISGWKLGYLDNTATFTYGDANTDTQDGAQLAFTDWSGNSDQSADNTYSTTFTANAIDASQSTAYYLDKNGTPSESIDEDLNMILIPQTLSAATAYASTTAGAKPNGSYIALKMVIKNNTDAGETVADATAAGKWAMWPIGGYNWEPGKKYTYTIDLAGGGYYETNQDGTDGNLDAILEGAEIKFATVTVDGWTDVAKYYPEALADLKARIGIEDCSGYVGKYVDQNGYITNNKTGSIGTIAHIKTDGDVDKSYAGSRIIVLSTNIVGNAPWDNCGTANPISLDETFGIYSGYAKTKHLYDANPSQYLAAKAAWEYQSKNGNAVITGSSGWFLPDGKQATDIYSNRYRNGLNLLDDDIFWASDEYGSNDALGWSKSGTQWCSSRTTSNKIYPCFVY